MANSLIRKLDIKEKLVCLFMDIPADYMDLLGGGLPEGARWGEDEPLDFIHVFVERPNELSDTFKYLKAILKQTGMLWMSWRKMQSDKMMDMKS